MDCQRKNHCVHDSKLSDEDLLDLFPDFLKLTHWEEQILSDMDLNLERCLPERQDPKSGLVPAAPVLNTRSDTKDASKKRKRKRRKNDSALPKPKRKCGKYFVLFLLILKLISTAPF